MGENRSDELALLGIRREIIIKPKKIIYVYANKHSRRTRLLTNLTYISFKTFVFLNIIN